MTALTKETAPIYAAIRVYGMLYVKPALVKTLFGGEAASVFNPDVLERVSLDFSVNNPKKDHNVRVRYVLRSDITILDRILKDYMSTIDVPICFFDQWIPEEEK